MEMFGTQGKLLLFAVGYPVVYYVFAIFLYSIAKLHILKMITPHRKIGMSELPKFFLLSILVFGGIFLIGLIVMMVLAVAFKQDFLKYIILVLGVPYLILAYTIFNLSHSHFAKGDRQGLIRISLKDPFLHLGYLPYDLLFFAGFFIVFNVINVILRYTIFLNQGMLSSFGPVYIKIYNALFLIVIYAVVAFNRIFFVKNVLQQHKPDLS